MSEHESTDVQMITDADSRYVVFMSERAENEEFIVTEPGVLRDLGEMQ